ncbi:hypothetical protein AvCA_33930 [Azotobacter vinelandii CA]|uniref:Uncharacterized protein n=2 Tax=Azotobacter vinelandii TaxID=354 RepID=C1DPX2_AZOVD|nr:hypothetical protein Avin_33930 [Azotobacter vinelandii DJ]AGK16328.1 hypothetical protein AvCA_33930 [Azotobacter vinelandii CA]AGK21310.1 hypothetical protein AvCA6_33930 [Azotobacter vinelandii CA6]
MPQGGISDRPDDKRTASNTGPNRKIRMPDPKRETMT